jgi:hypothetical protein
MEINDIIKFKPIDITHIVITIGLALIIIYAFQKQLNSFFETLKDRPITVTMSGSATTIELDVPAKPELLVESISNPQGNEDQLNNWQQTIQNVNNIDGFQKLGFSDLYNKLSALTEGELAVINFTIDDSSKNYFGDEAMLKYLSIAAEKIRYLALYKGNEFVAAIGIEDVISGLASQRYEFSDFGQKLKNGAWRELPTLITRDLSFERNPTVRELHNRLNVTKLSEIPLLKNGQLSGFLNHKSISEELYAQVSEI